MNMTRFKILILALGLLAAGAIPAVHAYAYNGVAAAQYADQYALNGNTAYYIFPGDCTSFASQALNQGGLPMVNRTYLPQDDRAWYIYFDVRWHWSNSWSVAGDNWQYLLNSGHGGHWYTWGGMYTTNHSGLYAGDVLYYSWDAPHTGGQINHMSIQAQDNFDEKNHWTSVVDEHTTNRFHVNWTLATFNQQANTTSIYAVHVS